MDVALLRVPSLATEMYCDWRATRTKEGATLTLLRCISKAKFEQ